MLLRSLFAFLPLLLCLGCGGDSKRERPSVVLVMVDQLRKDAADRWMTETVSLARRGVTCERMRSVAPWTYPSVISLLSGLYPQQHGADGDASGKRLTVFSEAVPLLPRTLGAAGYHTAGFVTNPFLHEWNPVHEAFDHYDASFIGNQGPRRGGGDIVWKDTMYADSVNPKVLAHFDARPYTQPEFLYVHYIDVHGRKDGPERWQGAPFGEDYRGGYERAVRYVDARIRELYDYFHARTGGNLIFLVTSDHGQDKGDDIQVGDGRPWRKKKASLHDFNLHIPLYVLPGTPVPQVVFEEPCANIDVAPTLLEWLDLPPTAGIPGRSLLGALRGGGYDGYARALYARNSAFGRFEEAVVQDEHKLIRYRIENAAPRRSFDLRNDPREIHPITDSVELEKLLDELGSAGRLSFPPDSEETSDELIGKLKMMGYGGDADQETDQEADKGD